MSDYRSCRNKCIFCFIDQMPPGMRETLYFKDDDSRLSFLQGNYVTLTNMKEHDIQVIKFQTGAHQHFLAYHEPGAALQDAAQPFCRGEALKKIDPLSVRRGNPHERPDRSVQGRE